MSWQQVLVFAGGIGLFLLGMRLMSDGLKIAAGPALRDLLAAATRSPLRGLASGALITALVQSSSAVIFATIGFVNAGLLSLRQAVGVIYGANLGTTTTSWLVAMVGFGVDLQLLAMPMLALGAGLWISGRGRRGALGQALAGFGIFFLGLDVLKEGFAHAGGLFDLGAWAGDGTVRMLAFTAVGFVLTVLMQSSSAALAVTLTAAAGGLVPLPAAAAMVIGANVGTTSTAVFAAIGATASARRAAAAHVVFNVVAAVLALASLPLLLSALVAILAAIGVPPQPAVVLALLHTATKLIGLAVIWPLTPWLVTLLERRFTRDEADPGEPRYLDRLVLDTPTLAIEALGMELRRMGAMAHRLVRDALLRPHDDGWIERDRHALEHLGEEVIAFAGAIRGGEGDAAVDRGTPLAVRVVQYYRGMVERATDLWPPPLPHDPALAAALATLGDAADRALAAAFPAIATAPDQKPPDPEAATRECAAFEATCQSAKALLLRAGGRGALTATSLVQRLDHASALHRVIGQSCKAATSLAALCGGGADDDCSAPDDRGAAPA